MTGRESAERGAPQTPEPLDDLLAMCGAALVVAKLAALPVEAGQKPPRSTPKRHTDWREGASFVSEGYVSRVTQMTCETCGSLTEVFEGVYHAERHSSGTRRLQALAKGAQWPAGQEWGLEVTRVFSLMCGGCVRSLGFSKVTDAPKSPFTLVVGEG